MTANEQPYVLVEIVWNDCVVSNGWTESSLTFATVKTAGYLVAEDDNAICVAGMVSDAGHFNAMVTIPKSCIVKRSLAAVLLEDSVVSPKNAAAIAIPDGDGWIPWKATADSVSPLPSAQVVNVRWSDGTEDYGSVAGDWLWHKGDIVSIIAYKVIKDS